MKLLKIYLPILIISILTLAISCTSLSDIENKISAVTTNMITITNTTAVSTNIITTTNIIRVTDTVYSTNIAFSTNYLYSITNYIDKTVNYEPVPQTIYVYADAGSHPYWSNPMTYWWYIDGSASGNITKLSNYNDGYIEWWVFELTNINPKKKFGVKLHDNNWADVEPIKTENGNKYDRVVSMPILTKNVETVTYTTNIVVTNNFTNTYITNHVESVYGTYDKIFIYSPANWYESWPYLLETETNLYKNLDGIDLWGEYMGANYWGNGVTLFTFYAPNIRRVWVAGDFSGWEELSMNLSTDRVWWWAIVSNSQDGDAYKYVIERYGNEWGGPWKSYISDPFAKKNEYSPAMDSGGNKSFIIDQSAFQWDEGWEFGYEDWTRPTADYYTIYQMHIRTFETNGPGDYWGWGTFITATNKFQYLKDMGFTSVYPLPIFEFAGDQSWGYNYILFYAPETAYIGKVMNTVEPLKVFVNAAHQKGLAVIFDLVFNHMGASDDVIGAFDPSINWNNPSTYFYSGKTDWGPAFNFANPVVRKFLTDSAVYLAQYYKADGFRFDATYFIYNGDTGSDGGNFLYNLSRDIRNRVSGFPNGPNILLIAENLPTDTWFGNKDGGAYDAQWNVDMAHHLKKLFTDGAGSITIDDIAVDITLSALDSGNNYSGLFGVNYLVSHDEAANGKQRTAADLRYNRAWGNGDYDAQYQQITGIATMMMARGIPQLLMGDEFLEGFYDDAYWGPPYNRRMFSDDRPLSWNNYYADRTGDINPDTGVEYPSRWRAGKTQEAVSALAWIRKDYSSVRGTDIWVIHKDNNNKVIGFGRGSGSGSVYVVINYDKQVLWNYDAKVPSGYELIYASPSAAYGDGGFDVNLTQWGGGNINIPKYGVLIYKQ